MTLPRGSPKTIFTLQPITVANLSFEVAMKIILWLLSPQHEDHSIGKVEKH